MDDTPEHIVELIRKGQRIEAVRVLREETGAGLAEAKDAVERIARTLDGAGGAPDAAPPVPPAGMTDDVVALARSGNVIAAIKLYRDQNGGTLAEARDAVLRVAGLPTAPANAAARVVVVAVLCLILMMAGIAAALIFAG